MNSCNTDMFSSNYCHLQSVRFEYNVYVTIHPLNTLIKIFKYTHEKERLIMQFRVKELVLNCEIILKNLLGVGRGAWLKFENSSIIIFPLFRL